MARKPRIHLPGGVYHVLLRGNGGQKIINGYTDENGDLLIADPTELTSTVFGNAFQLGGDINMVISPSKK